MRSILKKITNRILSACNVALCKKERLETSDPIRAQSYLIKKSNPVIFDVGAYIGEVSSYYRELFPHSIVHAFEPFPESFRQLRTRFHNDPTVTLNQLAVSDAEGSVTFNVNLFNQTNSILSSNPEGADIWGKGLLDTTSTIQVPTTTIDAYCSTKQIHHIDILKLDIQGAELKALQGSQNMLRDGRVDLVYLEVILGPTYIGQPELEDYLRFFKQMGYTLFDLFNPIRKDLRLIQADIIFVRKSSGTEAFTWDAR